MRTLLFEGSIDICGHNVGVRIYKEPERYSFEPSEYLQEEGENNVYRIGSGAMAATLEDLLVKIKIFKDRYTQIVKSEPNPHY